MAGDPLAISSKMHANARGCAKEILAAFPKIKQIWTYATSPDHNNARCVDFMVYDDRALGDAIAKWILDRRRRLGVEVVIWHGRIWRSYDKLTGTASPSRAGVWAAYKGPKNHNDHPHVQFNALPYEPPKDATVVKPAAAADDELEELRLLNVNVRLYSLSREDGHPWDDKQTHTKPAGGAYRVKPFLQMLTDLRPDVLAVQECDQEDVVPGLLAHLRELTGSDWQHYMLGKVGLIFNLAKLQLVEGDSLRVNMDNEADADRRFVLAKLRSVKTGRATGWGASHFGVHYEGVEAERRHQAWQALGFLAGKNLTAFDRLILAGDWNEPTMPPEPGVREIFARAGLVDLRTRLDDAAVSGDSWATHHGYKPLQKAGDGNVGRWLDDVLTSPGVQVVSAKVIDTSPTGPYPNATDHCGQLVAVKI